MSIQNNIKTASILVIGDEVLSGQVREAHVQYIATRLEECGIVLNEVRIIPDNLDVIVRHINYLRKTHTYLFTTGGIGGTHDDKTVKALSIAFEANLVKSEDIQKLVKDKRFCNVPIGAGLIPNSISKDPGFFLENVFCLAGFPEISKVMFDEVIKHIEHGDKIFKESVTIDNLMESQIADELEAIENQINQNQTTQITIGSYPYYLTEKNGITFVIKGRDQSLVSSAKEMVLQMISKHLK